MNTTLPRIGVLHGGRLIEYGGHSEPCPVDLLAALELAERRKLAQVWLLPVYANQHDYNPLSFGPEDYAAAEAAGWSVSPNRAADGVEAGAWLRCYPRGRYGRYAIVQPMLDSRTPFADAHTPAELLAALVGYAAHMGIAWEASGGATGQALMRLTLASMRTTITPAATVPPAALRPRELLDGALVWLRDLTPEELGARRLVSLDRNGAYLSAAGGTRLGIGEPRHITRETIAGAMELDTYSAPEIGARWRYPAGLYRVDVEHYAAHAAAHDTHDGRTPPVIAASHRGQVWASAPTLDYLSERGYLAQIEEAWIYPTSARWLERWYKRVKDAREHILSASMQALDVERRQAAAIALAAVKQTYTWALSWLASRSDTWQRDDDALYRPDAQQAIRAYARSAFLRPMYRAAEAGYYPFAASTDAWYYLTDLDGEELAARAGYRLGVDLGAWKLAEYDAPALVELLADTARRPNLRLGDLLSTLNAIDAQRAADLRALAAAISAQPRTGGRPYGA